jgi:hypothetical protein
VAIISSITQDLMHTCNVTKYLRKTLAMSGIFGSEIHSALSRWSRNTGGRLVVIKTIQLLNIKAFSNCK